MRLPESACDFLPNPFRRERLELARSDDLAHQRSRLARDLEAAEARGKARNAQHPQRIFDERRRYMAKDAGAKIFGAVVGVDQRAVLVPRHRIDREIAPCEVLRKRHFGRRKELEAAIAAPMFALGARKGIFLAR